MKKNIIIVINILLLISMDIIADSFIKQNQGRVFGAFLKNDIEAFSLAKAGQGAISMQSSSALMYNPAGIGYVDWKDLSIAQYIPAHGIMGSAFSFVAPIGFAGTMGFSISGQYALAMEEYEEYGTVSEKFFGGSDWSLNFGFGKYINWGLTWGISIKGIFNFLPAHFGFAMALDTGLIFEPFDFPGLKLSLVAKNLGAVLTAKEETRLIPIGVRAGIEYMIPNEILRFGFEADWSIDDYPLLMLGFEFNIKDIFYPKIGFRYRPPYADVMILSGFTFGGTFKFFNKDDKGVLLNYAFFYDRNFGATHRFSLDAQF